MANHAKSIVTLLSLIGGVGFLSTSAQSQTAGESLIVYAGPQTVSPQQNINVTIEMTERDGRSVNNETVYLNYILDGVSTSVSGIVSNGLVSFEVQAPLRAGTMTFMARVGELTSNSAQVLVVAAQPCKFELNIEPSRAAHLIDLSTEVITDRFGNPVADQTSMTLDWIDGTGLKRSEIVQLNNGRLSYVSDCSEGYAAPLKIRAVLKNVEVFSSDFFELCSARKISS